MSWAGRGTKDHMPLNTSASLILQTPSSYARGLRGGQGRGASPHWRREARGAGRGAGTSSQASRPSATPGLAQSRPPGQAAAPAGLCFLVGVVRILSPAGDRPVHEPAVGSRAGPAGGAVLGPCSSTRRGLGLRGGRGGGKRVLRLLAGSHQATLSGVHPVASSGVITLSISHPSQATDPPTAPRVHRRTDPGKPGSPPCRACPCGWSKPPTGPETVRLLSTDSAEAVPSPRANQTPIDFAAGPYSSDAFPDSLGSC